MLTDFNRDKKAITFAGDGIHQLLPVPQLSPLHQTFRHRPHISSRLIRNAATRSRRFPLLFQEQARSFRHLPTGRIERVGPAKICNQNIAAAIPHFTICVQRRMGVMGTYLAPGVSNHTRHKYIHLKPARVRVRPDQRPQTRPCWNARIGNFEKQSERLAYVTSHLRIEVIEGLNRYLFRSERQR